MNAKSIPSPSKNPTYLFGIYIFSLLVFLSMQPFVVWGRTWLFVILTAALFILYFVSPKKNNTNGGGILLISASIIFFVYLTIPFREHDFFTFKHAAYLPVLVLAATWLGRDMSIAWEIIRRIFCFIVILSITSTALFYFNAPFPNIEIETEFRAKDTDIYRLYYGMIYLNTQLYSIGSGVIIRNIGWFGEPGHFGIYLCLLLIGQANPLAGRTNKILALGVASTLSAASYVILLIIIALNRNSLKAIGAITGIIAIAFIAELTLGAGSISNIVFSKLSPEDGLLTGREYINDRFISRDTLEHALGLGRGVLEFYGMQSSNLTAFIWKYGIVSVLLFFSGVTIVCIHLLSKGLPRKALLLITILTIISLHRSWMIDTLYIWTLLFTLYYLTAREPLNTSIKEPPLTLTFTTVKP